jgi:hypothetical protein
MSIALTRARVTELSDHIHSAYRELFEASVRVIEQTLHGSVARGVKAKAEHLAAVSKGMELKLQYVHIFVIAFDRAKSFLDFLRKQILFSQTLNYKVHYSLTVLI